jgi:hypothetical protein
MEYRDDLGVRVFLIRGSNRVTASDNTTARQKLDEAVSILVIHGVPYSGEVPGTSGRIWAYQLQQILDGVR